MFAGIYLISLVAFFKLFKSIAHGKRRIMFRFCFFADRTMSSRTRTRIRTTSDRSSPDNSFSSAYRDSSHVTDTDSDQDISKLSGNDDVNISHISSSTDYLDVEGDMSPFKVPKSYPKLRSPKRTKRSPSNTPVHGTAYDSPPKSLYPSLAEFKNEDKTLFDRPKRPKNLNSALNKKNVHSETSDSAQTWNISVCVICVIVCVAAIAIFIGLPYLMQGSNDNDLVTERQSSLDIFQQKFDSFRLRFPAQTTRFWLTLKAAAKGLLKQANPSQPAVIVIAMHQSHSVTGKCIAEQFSNMISNVYNTDKVKPIDATYMSSTAAKMMKQHIEDQMHHALGNSKAKSLVFHHLENVPGEAAMMFHAFCDNENAPYKDAMLVFTLSIPESQWKPGVENDSLVEQVLTRLWEQDLDIDKYTALMSRVVRNAVYIRSESYEVLQYECK